ncbi:MAG: hypothetical protein IPP87_23150 [Ideonella sp.]|nr:hypothetical protein [Ideonella sp.]
MKLRDSPEIALADWIRFGELDEHERLPRQWPRTMSSTGDRRCRSS